MSNKSDPACPIRVQTHSSSLNWQAHIYIQMQKGFCTETPQTARTPAFVIESYLRICVSLHTLRATYAVVGVDGHENMKLGKSYSSTRAHISNVTSDFYLPKA